MTKAKTFRDWTRQDLANEFGLRVKRDCEVLNNWLDVKEITLEENENTALLQLQERLIKYVDIWNEQELIIKFISISLLWLITIRMNINHSPTGNYGR